MAGLLLDLQNSIANALDMTCIDLANLKKSYFSPKGKSGWNPLKKSTIRVKERYYPQNSTSFNMATGKLRDSLVINWEQTGSGAKITVNFDDGKGDVVIKYLTQTLGRNFIDTDDFELEFIKDKFIQHLVEQYARS